MSDQTVVTVGYERKFSDGNYGSEGLSLSWTVTYDDSGTDAAANPNVIRARCKLIAESLRDSVLSELASSQAGRVASAAKQELFGPEREPVSVTELEEMPF